MTLKYGYVKCTAAGTATIKSKRLRRETQYHLHVPLNVAGSTDPWDVAVNVGTNDSDDLLRYRMVYDFQHPLLATLRSAAPGFQDLTGTAALPALDFLRTDVLDGTGSWRDSDLMDGGTEREPYYSLAKVIDAANANGQTIYIFGRLYTEGDGIHDIHMNQGSTGSFVNHGNDNNDHNDVWQDGAVLVETSPDAWAAYFTAFTQQSVPTDAEGNVARSAHEITDTDPGSLAGS